MIERRLITDRAEWIVSQNTHGPWRGYWSASWSTPAHCGLCCSLHSFEAAVRYLETVKASLKARKLIA
jgi:hypothetical protein